MDRKNTCAFTLRITPELDEAITNAAWFKRTSKAAWIRAAIRQRLRLADAEHDGLEKKQCSLTTT